MRCDCGAKLVRRWTSRDDREGRPIRTAETSDNHRGWAGTGPLGTGQPALDETRKGSLTESRPPSPEGDEPPLEACFYTRGASPTCEGLVGWLGRRLNEQTSPLS